MYLLNTADLNFFVNTFISIFAIVNPIGNTPLFLSFTEGKSIKDKKKIAFRASLTSFLILLLFIFLGKGILTAFRVTIPAFHIAGGILIFIIGLTMLHAFRLWVKTTPHEEKEAVDKEDVAVIPLGIPILSGPGAITTVMVFTFQQPGLEGKLLVSLASLLTCIITYFVFSESGYLMKIMGQTEINLLTRLMGLLLTVKAVQFFINGLSEVIPFLTK